MWILNISNLSYFLCTCHVCFSVVKSSFKIFFFFYWFWCISSQFSTKSRKYFETKYGILGALCQTCLCELLEWLVEVLTYQIAWIFFIFVSLQSQWVFIILLGAGEDLLADWWNMQVWPRMSSCSSQGKGIIILDFCAVWIMDFCSVS